MGPATHTIDIGVREQTGDLLRRLEGLPPGTRVRLNVPRDAVTMRTLDDYNMLRDVQKRQQIQLTVASPEATIIGLARIYGFDVENLGTGRPAEAPASVAGGDEALPQWNRGGPAAPAPPTADWPVYSGAEAPRVSAPPAPAVGSLAPPPARTVASAAPGPALGLPATFMPPGAIFPAAVAPAVAPPPEVSETDWLFSEGAPVNMSGYGPVDLDEDAPRSSTPPPDVVLPAVTTFTPPAAPALEPPPPARGGDLDEFGGLDDMDLGSTEDAQLREEIAVQDAARREERAAAGLADPHAPTPVDDGTSPLGAAAAVATGGLRGRLSGMLGRKPAEAPPPEAGGRTFVDRTESSRAPATVLGRTPVEPPERRPAASPPTDDERVAVSTRPVNGRGTHLDAGAAGGARPAPRVAPRPTLPRREQTRPSGMLIVLGVLVILLGLAVILFANRDNFFPRTATVTITVPARGDLGLVKIQVPVLTTGAAGRGLPGLAAPRLLTETVPLTPTRPLTITAEPRTAPPVQAQRIAVTIRVTQTVATTGRREKPNHAAIGTVRFTNAGQGAFAVNAGTLLIATNGKRFHTVDRVVVPGTDFANQQFGSVEVDVQAAEPGPDSNGAQLTGRTGDGAAFFATVRAPGGGDTVAVPVVAAADLATVRARLHDDLVARVGQDLRAAIPPNLTPITCTLPVATDVADTSTMVNPLPEVDSAATEVTGIMTADVAVYAFAPAQVQHQAALAALAILPPKPSSLVQAALDPASIPEIRLTLTRLSGCENGRVLYGTEIHPTLVYTVTGGEAILTLVKERVAGKSQAEAETVVQALFGGLASVQVKIDAAALNSAPDRLPGDVNQITVALTGAGVQAPGATPVLSPRPAPPGAKPTPTGEPK